LSRGSRFFSSCDQHSQIWIPSPRASPGSTNPRSARSTRRESPARHHESVNTTTASTGGVGSSKCAFAGRIPPRPSAPPAAPVRSNYPSASAFSMPAGDRLSRGVLAAWRSARPTGKEASRSRATNASDERTVSSPTAAGAFLRRRTAKPAGRTSGSPDHLKMTCNETITPTESRRPPSERHIRLARQNPPLNLPGTTDHNRLGIEKTPHRGLPASTSSREPGAARPSTARPNPRLSKASHDQHRITERRDAEPERTGSTSSRRAVNQTGPSARAETGRRAGVGRRSARVRTISFVRSHTFSNHIVQGPSLLCGSTQGTVRSPRGPWAPNYGPPGSRHYSRYLASLMRKVIYSSGTSRRTDSSPGLIDELRGCFVSPGCWPSDAALKKIKKKKKKKNF